MSKESSPRAVWSLVFGILSFVMCPLIGSVLAIVLGWGETAGVGRAGKILGFVSLFLSLLGLLVWVVIAMVVGGAAIAHH